MIWRLLKRTFWIALLFIASYFVVIKLAVTWLQASPKQVTAFVSQHLGVTLSYKALNIEQTWSGLRVQTDDLHLEHSGWVLRAYNLDVDLNFWSPFWPGLAYGERLVGEGIRLHVDTVPTETEAFSLQDGLAKLTKLWKIIDIRDVKLTGAGGPVHEWHLESLKSNKALRWSILGDVKLLYGDAYRAARFHFSARFTLDRLGLIEEGQINLSSLQGVELNDLYQPWLNEIPELARMPDGQGYLNASVMVRERRVQQVDIGLDFEGLNWPTAERMLPAHIQTAMTWQAEQHADAESGMLFDLHHILFDQQPLSGFSPISLAVRQGRLTASGASLSLAEISPILGHVWGAGIVSLRQVELRDLALDFDLEHLSIVKAHAHLAQFNWYTEDLTLSLAKVKLDYASSRLQVMFDEPIRFETPHTEQAYYQLQPLDTLVLDLDWISQAWHLTPLALELNQLPLKINADGDFSGYVDANVNLRLDNMRQVKTQLLPYGLMHQDLVDWLQMALVDGRKIEGDLRLQGALANFPFTDSEGILRVEAKVEDGVLAFHPDWPPLEHIQAQLLFTPYDLTIISDHAFIHGARGRDIRVDIKHLTSDDIAVEFSALASTDVQNGINFLLASPIAQSLGMADFLQRQVTGSGQIDVALDRVFVPIDGYDDLEEQVSGNLRFEDASIRLFDTINVQAVTGRLRFSEKGLDAQGVSAEGLNAPLLMDVTNQPERKKVGLHIRGESDLPAEYGMTGDMPWVLDIDIPYVSSAEKTIEMKFMALTEGLESDWPEPFATEHIRQAPLNASLDYAEGELAFQLDWLHLMQARLQLSAQGEQGLQLKQAQVSMGEVQYQAWLNEPGVQMQVQLEQLNIDAWRDKVEQISRLLGGWGGSNESLSWLPSRLTSKNITLFQQAYPSIEANWQSSVASSSIIVELLADYIKAELNYHKEAGIDVGVDYLRLNLSDEFIDQSVDASGAECKTTASIWPSIRFQGRNLFIGQRLFDRISFQLDDSPLLRSIEQIQFEFANRSGRGDGVYKWLKTENKSELKAKINSQNVQAFTDFLGINRGFSGQRAQMEGNFNWNTGLNCLSLANINGSFNMRFEQGRIDEVEPGIARLIGLLSIDSIVRRLQLDVKDVTMKGLEYDTIRVAGSFQDANLALTQLKMEGTSLNAELKGRIGMVAKDFDLKAQVTPAIGGVLPTIAGLMGVINPVTGVLTYLLAKHLPFINEDIITYDYQIKGTWADPEIKSQGGSILFK